MTPSSQVRARSGRILLIKVVATRIHSCIDKLLLGKVFGSTFQKFIPNSRQTDSWYFRSLINFPFHDTIQRMVYKDVRHREVILFDHKHFVPESLLPFTADGDDKLIFM